MASFCLQLKNFLVAGGWSVVQSCNASSFSTAGTDYWSALADVTFAAGTSNHSWVVLKSPAGLVAGLDGTYAGDQSRLWLSIDCNYANTAAQAKFYVHRANPAIGTPGISLCPTSTYQWGWAGQQFLRTTLNTNALFHFRCTAKGAFMVDVGYVGSGYTPFAMDLLPVTSVKRNALNTLDYPFATCGYSKWNDANYGARYNTIWAPDSSNGNQSGTYQGPYGAYCLGWAYDGTVATLKLGMVAYGVISFFANFNSTVSIFRQIGEAFPAAGDAWGGAQNIGGDVPVVCVTTGKTAAIGILSDITCSGLPCPQGSVNDDSTVASTMLGSYWVPANARPIL